MAITLVGWTRHRFDGTARIEIRYIYSRMGGHKPRGLAPHGGVPNEACSFFGGWLFERWKKNGDFTAEAHDKWLGSGRSSKHVYFRLGSIVYPDGCKLEAWIMDKDGGPNTKDGQIGTSIKNKMGIKIARNSGLMWGSTIEWDLDFPLGEPASISFRKQGQRRFLGAQVTVILLVLFHQTSSKRCHLNRGSMVIPQKVKDSRKHTGVVLLAFFSG